MPQKTVLSLGDREKKHISKFVLLLLFLAGEFLFVTLYFASQPSEDSRAIVFGYSLLKFSIIVLLSLVTFVELGAALSVIHGNRLGVFLDGVTSDPKHEIFIIRFLGLFGGICWIIYFIPPRYFHTLESYIILMSPFLILGVLISCQIIAFILLEKEGKIEFLKQFWFQNKKNLVIWVAISITFIAVWAFIAISRIGLSANNEDYWYEAGVPVLGWQALLGLLIGLLFTKLETSAVLGKRLFPKGDLLIFMLIWLVGGFLWAQTPVPNGFLNPGPYPPTYETYPYADAARFDLMSQYALIGQGINNGKIYNRPVYPAFLVFLHLISGQNYEQNMQFQAFLFGVFPALIYLIAKFLSNRGAGVAVSAIIIMRGINGIAATNMINLANQKQMLTDFPTAIGLGTILLVCILWGGKPHKSGFPLLVGGVFGITLYLRQTILGVLPFILLLPMVSRKNSVKRQFVMLGIFFLGVFAVLAPYELKNFVYSPRYTYPEAIKKIISVVKTRYPQLHVDMSKQRYDDNVVVEPNIQDENPVDSRSELYLTNTGGLSFVGSHFLHNIVTSILILPNSFTFENLKRSITSGDTPWIASWNGRLQFEQLFILCLNILLIALGIVSSINKLSLTGLVPLCFFIGYNLANALGRTSGGRYIVPVDWIVILYFGIGLFQICIWILNPKRAKKDLDGMRTEISSRNMQITVSRHRRVMFFILLLMPSAFLILPDFVFPRQIEKLNPAQLRGEIANYDLTGNQVYLEKLLVSKGATILAGKIMYPRYYHAGAGEISFDFPYKPLDYSRLAFYLIGPIGTNNVLLAGSIPTELTSSSNAIVIGCKEKGFIDAAMVILTDYQQRVYFRDPLPEPVCSFPAP